MATPPNPMLLQLMQRLKERMGGAGGPPGGLPGGAPGAGGPPPGSDPGAALGAVRDTAQTPFGQEYEELDRLKSSIQTLVPRLLSRIPKEAPDVARCISTLDKAMKALRESPQMPLAAPPPNLPMAGIGPGMPAPAEPTGPAF